MAEAIGLVASVVQLAGTGLKLSQALYQYADGVANADRRIKEVAKEIKLTSFVIEELGNVFKQDDTLSLISVSAVATANETLKECSAVFSEIETSLNKSRKGRMGRLMLPFRESKIELLRSHIDKLKSTLQLLMQVLLHAHQVASKKIDRETEARQRDEIRQLLEEKRNATQKYEESLRNLTISDSSTEVGDGEFSIDDKGSPSMVEIKAIGSTVDPDSLVECMQHVRILLESIERLQKALANRSEGDDHSGHHQTAIESYFAARSHLDNVLLGSSNAASFKGPMLTREPINMKTSIPDSDDKHCSYDTVPIESTLANVKGRMIQEKSSAEPRERDRSSTAKFPRTRPRRPARRQALFGGSQTDTKADEPVRIGRIAFSSSHDQMRQEQPSVFGSPLIYHNTVPTSHAFMESSTASLCFSTSPLAAQHLPPNLPSSADVNAVAAATADREGAKDLQPNYDFNQSDDSSEMANRSPPALPRSLTRPNSYVMNEPAPLQPLIYPPDFKQHNGEQFVVSEGLCSSYSRHVHI